MVAFRCVESSAARRLVVSALAASLVIHSVPLDAARPSVEGAVPADALVVDSVPAGARVYVDGQLRGETPVSIARLPVGDHRVRVVKDGYLENGRIVNVSARQPARVRVTLTRSGEADGQVVTPGSGSGGGGGSKKWLIIGGAAAAAAVAAVALKPKNAAPTAGSITMTPNEVGLASATNFSFTATGAADADGDALTYTWDFGDGASATGAQVTHTFATAGTRTVKVTVSDGKLSASATGSVNVRDFAGTWGGTVSNSSITMQLSQSGAVVSGTYTATFVCGASNGSSGSVSATVSAAKAIAFTLTNPPCNNLVMSGTADANVAAATGTIVSGFTGGGNFTLTRR